MKTAPGFPPAANRDIPEYVTFIDLVAKIDRHPFQRPSLRMLLLKSSFSHVGYHGIICYRPEFHHGPLDIHRFNRTRRLPTDSTTPCGKGL